MRRTQLIVATLAGLGLASQAQAVDGVQEINAACAAVGCFPGDAPGYPVQLNAAAGRSYRLTSDLNFSLPDANVDAITISVDEVRLDLNGFKIRGPAGGGGSGRGILATGISPLQSANPTIVNGAITGMRGRGIEFDQVPGVRIEGVTLIGNAGGGAIVGPRSVVVESRFEDNGAIALEASSQTEITVRNSIFEGHTLTGISVGAYSNVAGNQVNGTGLVVSGYGIRTGGGSTVIDNRVLEAPGIGIQAGPLSIVEKNVVQGALGLYGLLCVQECRVVGNTVHESNNIGLDAGSRSLAKGNIIHDNGTVGLVLSANSIFIGNVISDNGTNQAQISGTTANGGQNVCAGPGTVTSSCP